MIDKLSDKIIKQLEVIPNPQRERNMSKNYMLLSLRDFIDCSGCENFDDYCLENCSMIRYLNLL